MITSDSLELAEEYFPEHSGLSILIYHILIYPGVSCRPPSICHERYKQSAIC